MNLFETESGEGIISYINPRYIINIEPCSHHAKPKTSITIQGGMTRTYWDKRSPETIVKLLKQFKP